MATILIIDDRAINRRFLSTLLKGCGHRVLEAPDGEEGLKIIQLDRVDLVMIDMLAPVLDGYRFVQRLRAEPDLVQPRVVFRAAASIENEARAFADACGAYFSPKPGHPDALLGVIDTALSQPQPAADGIGSSGPGSAYGFLLQIARALQGYSSSLERLNARLDQGIAQRDSHLAIARAAVDQEIKKRIWAEQELTQANYGLRDLVVHDELTGLHNRRYLDESLDREESRALRSRRPLAFMMIDIDRFKDINDSYGHAAGDAALRAIGGYLMSIARGEDIVCRYGGEEFVLVMAQTPRETVRDRAEKIRSGVQAIEIEHEGHALGPMSVSIGVGMFPDHGENARDVLRVADRAMYRAKQSGRNRVEFGTRVKS
jgi:diguanylate cyclase (GGDEF)-like protein